MEDVVLRIPLQGYQLKEFKRVVKSLKGFEGEVNVTGTGDEFYPVIVWGIEKDHVMFFEYKMIGVMIGARKLGIETKIIPSRTVVVDMSDLNDAMDILKDNDIMVMEAFNDKMRISMYSPLKDGYKVRHMEIQAKTLEQAFIPPKLDNLSLASRFDIDAVALDSLLLRKTKRDHAIDAIISLNKDVMNVEIDQYNEKKIKVDIPVTMFKEGRDTIRGRYGYKYLKIAVNVLKALNVYEAELAFYGDKDYIMEIETSHVRMLIAPRIDA